MPVEHAGWMRRSRFLGAMRYHRAWMGRLIGWGLLVLLAGNAIAIAAANRVLMLENSIYSVISPEGCASILWRSGDKARDAAEALKLTAQDLKALNVIDEIIPEPEGGAHRDTVATVEKVGDCIYKHLQELLPLSRDNLKKQRNEKFLEMGRNLNIEA